MDKSDIIILGAGGFAREVKWILSKAKELYNIIAFYEEIENCDRINDVDSFLEGFPIINSLDKYYHKNICLINAVGHSSLRKKWYEIFSKDFIFPQIICIDSLIGENVTIDNGSIITSNCILTCDIEIGKCSLININTTIGHDSSIGDFCTISPGCNISGNVEIGDKCFIGSGVTILPKIKIGNNSIIGAGAVVIDDIPDNVLAVGVPAKIRKSYEKTINNNSYL